MQEIFSAITKSYSRDPKLERYMSAIELGIKSAKDECPEVY